MGFRSIRKRLPLGDMAKRPGLLPGDMKVRRQYRRRDDTEVAVLEALADRYDDGMTVFELRSVVGVDIDELEMAISNLKESNLISAESVNGRTLITVDESVIEEETAETGQEDFIDRILDRLGL